MNKEKKRPIFKPLLLVFLCRLGGNNFYDTKQRRQRKIGSGATKQGESFTQRNKEGKGAKLIRKLIINNQYSIFNAQHSTFNIHNSSFLINHQGTIVEATVVPKLNQGTNPKTGCNRFRGSFFVTFLEKQKSK